ncbi:MAG TPA: hypothetical protein PLD81_06675 [Elusimicrobiales bacterium]|nr:hypothetical protein [Elusimicrobiales bacterium]
MDVFLLFLFLNNVLNSTDKSSIYCTGEGSTYTTKVNLIIEDQFGNRSGCDNITCYKNIPNSSFGRDSISDINSNEPNIETLTVYIRNIKKGYYYLKVFTTENDIIYLNIDVDDLNGNKVSNIDIKTLISTESFHLYSIYLDPTPGAPPPVLTKVVTFQALKEDIEVAYKLNQIGDEKFKDSLIRMLNIAEKYYNKCQVLNNKSNDKKDIDKRKICYRPVVATVRMMMKRLEVINKLCDNPKECKPKCKTKPECDEDEVFKGFDNKYRKDAEFKDFFSEWDKDEYHKHKKTCKRYITDEALEIITTDINWLIKSFGEEVWNDYKKKHNPYIPEKYKQFFK